MLAAGLLGLLVAAPLSAEEAVLPPPASSAPGVGQPPAATPAAPACVCPAPPADCAQEPEPPPWETAWGLVALRGFISGPKIAPNGQEYHPLFSLDFDFNIWLWRSQKIYLFNDTRFWGEKSENGVTNGHDGGLGFSKREFDLFIGPAWNYYGNWEARIFGYSLNNLNRGNDLVAPFGFNDGFGVENRYYLSDEYSRLGQTGFDVARATFVSLGYYPTKDMVGNDGQTFHPGAFLRAYLIYDLWDWPAYAFADAQLICMSDFQPKLLLYDLGVAARPIPSHRQWEFRLGVENTADLQIGSVYNLLYGAIRYIF
jgi:hypothetical protein